MSENVKIKYDIDSTRIKNKYQNKTNDAIRIIKSEIAKDTESLVPFRDGTLRRSVSASLSTDDPRIVYSTPYAKFLYYGKVMVGKITRKTWAKKGETKETINKNLIYSQGGSFWFKKSKEKNINKWLNIVKKLYN